MNNGLKRVGLVFDSEGNVEFVKSLKEANAMLRENYNQFKICQAEWNNSTSITEKLTQQQKNLISKYEIQQDKIIILKRQLEELSLSEENNEKAIAKKQRELVQAEIQLKKYGTELKSIESKLNSTVLKTEDFVKSLNQIGSSIENVGKKISVFSGLATAGFTASLKSAIDFESAFTGVEKTVDGTAEQLNELKDGIRNLAKEIPSTTTEISSVAEAAGQLGIETDNILNFTKTMINMGNATNLSAEEAATTLARFANITNMSQKDFDKLGSTIVALGNNFATTESEIAQMGMNLASAGSQIGMTQSEIMALATALSSVGLEAQAGGTAFSKLMINMQLAVETGNEQLTDFARVAGMSSEEFSKAFKENAVKALLAFISGLSKTGEQGNSAIKVLDEMGITETRLRDSILRSTNAANLFNNAIELGNNAWNENTALTNEADKRYNTLKSKLEIVKNKLLDNAITLGNKLMPIAEKMITKVDNITNKISNMNDEQLETIIRIGALVIAAGPAITIIGKLTSGIGSAVKGFSTFSDALKVAGGKITSTKDEVNNLANIFQVLSNPKTLAVVGITTALTMIVNAVSKTKNDVKENFKAMGDSAAEFINGIKTAESHLNDFNSTLFASTEEQQELQNNMSEIQQAITEITRRASDERRCYTDEEIKKLDEYFQELRDLKNRELEIQQNIASAITQQASTIAESYSGSLDEYKMVSQEWLKTAQDQAKNQISLIESSTIEEIALLNQRYGDEANMQNQAYALEYDRIMWQKQNKINAVNDEVAKVNLAFTNGFAERINQSNNFFNKLKSLQAAELEEKNRHINELSIINNNEKLDFIQKQEAIQYETSEHNVKMEKIWKDMYANMSESESKQLGVWLAMVSDTELYGGKIDKETETLVKSIIGSYNIMPSETKKTMKQAMLPMLQTMEETEPLLYSKASSIANGILSKLRTAFDIHSPSRKTKEIFKNVMLGMEKGIESEEKNLYNHTDAISKNVLNNLENMNEPNFSLLSSQNYLSSPSLNNIQINIDYNQLYLILIKALNSCKISIDDEGFIKMIDDRLREVI